MPSAINDIHAIRIMAEYLLGPGFDGWLAWIDQQSRQMADACPGCGEPHELPEVHAEVVRANLERYAHLGEAAGI